MYKELVPLILDKTAYFNLEQYLFVISKITDYSVDFDVIKNLIKSDSLTTFGQKNLSAITTIFKDRFNKNPPKEISDFSNYLFQFNSINEIISNEQLGKYLAVALEKEIRESENVYRINNGLPKIGEGWISETELYYKIKCTFSNYNVIHHGKPHWIGRQHLDIYIEELNLGIEYMGSQHYEPIDFFGGEESLAKTIERDRIKIEKCKINSCTLFIVNVDYLFEEIVQKINSIILNNTDFEVMEFPLSITQ
jgi:hypothetical protein